jgi:hypothetical protein
MKGQKTQNQHQYRVQLHKVFYGCDALSSKSTMDDSMHRDSYNLIAFVGLSEHFFRVEKYM